MSDPDFKIDIEELMVGASEEYLDITKLKTGTAQARQKGITVKKDSKLVGSIRRIGGLQNSIIVEKEDDGTYEIISGQRRWGAYKILVEESEKYKTIRARVITKVPKLTDEEKKVISFVENFGRDDMERSDYVDVIDYFYRRYGRKISQAAAALGISTGIAKKFLHESRLSDRVRALVDAKEFTIDTVIKALDSLGEDEESVDDDMLIATAKALKALQPARRRQVIKKLAKQRDGEKDIQKAIDEVPAKLVQLNILANEDQIEKLDRFKTKHDIDEDAEAAGEAFSIGLDHDLGEEEET